MLLLALAGLWALAFGHISVTSSLSLEGRRARFYGLTLLIAAPVYGILEVVASGTIAVLAPGLAANEVLGMVARIAVVIVIVLGLVPLFREKPAGRITGVYKS